MSGMVDHESGGRVCIIDEFGPYQLALNWFNKLCDSDELSVPYKGGFVQWNCECLFITTNYDPARIYPQYSESAGGKLERTGLPEPSFYSRVDEHFEFNYHHDHQPSALFTDRIDTARFAVRTQIK